MEKQLRRVKQGAVLGGVAGGLAQYFNIDVVIVRLLFVVSLFVSFGVSLFAYIVLWVVLPEDNYYRYNSPASPGYQEIESTPPPTTGQDNTTSDRNIKIIAIGLIGFGVVILLDQYIVWYSLSKYFWPIAMIAVGAFLLLRKRDQDYESRLQDPSSTESRDRFSSSTPPSDSEGDESSAKQKDDSDDSFKVN